MTAIEAQSSLFGTPLDPHAPTIDYPGMRVKLTRSGNRVTGSMHLEKPNPAGRTNCRVNYTARASWSPEQEAAAMRIVGHWFQLIGGMAMIRNHQICHVISRLRDGAGERWMHVAIDTYAASEWHRAHRGRFTTIGKFFGGEAYEKWLEQSEAYSLQISKDQAARVKTRRDDDRRTNETLPAIHALSDRMLRKYYRAAERDRTAYKEVVRTANMLAVRELSPNILLRFRKQVSMKWVGHENWKKCKDWLDSPDDDCDSLFDFEVHFSAVRFKCRKLGCVNEDLYTAFKASQDQPYRPIDWAYRELRSEATLRATVDAKWLRGLQPWQLVNSGEAETARDLYNAIIESRFDNWLADRPCEFAKEEARYRSFAAALDPPTKGHSTDQGAKIRADFDAPSTPDRTAVRSLESLNQPTTAPKTLPIPKTPGSAHAT